MAVVANMESRKGLNKDSSEELARPDDGKSKNANKKSGRASRGKVRASNRLAGQAPLTFWFKKSSSTGAVVSKQTKGAAAMGLGKNEAEAQSSIGKTQEPKGSVCPHCEKVLKNSRGLSVHTRSMHPLLYHAKLAKESQRPNSRWSEQERVPIACEEARLKRAGVDSRQLNRLLSAKFQHRTADSIKCLRRDERYRTMVIAEARELNEKVSRPIVEKENEICMVPNVRDNVLPAWKTRLERALARKRTNAHQCSSAAKLNGEFKRWIRQVAPTKRYAKAIPPRPPTLKGNRNARRKRLRAAWLTAYERHPARTSRRVLDGKSLEDREKFPAGMEAFWNSIFGMESRPVGRLEKKPFSAEHEELLRPITGEEVKTHLRGMKAGAAGVDGITLAHLRAVNPYCLAEWFNSFILLGTVPRSLKHFRTIFLKKVDEPDNPTQYRPITIGSYVRRTFAGIIARRLRVIVNEHSQRGFIETPGCAINQDILRAVVDRHIGDRKPLCYCFLDVAKAFDSVSHERLEMAYREANLPKGISDLFADMYRGNTTVFSGGEEVVRIKRGVLQGDPLSPTIFNLVMDMAVRSLKESVGATLGDTKVSSLLFADDAVLFAENSHALQLNVNRFVQALSKFGLKVNSSKSASVKICVNGRKKTWYVDHKPSIEINGDNVEALKVGEAYKYLGLKLSLGKCVNNTVKDLDVMLHNITRSVLKPQHKLAILRSHAIPRIQYALDLGESSKGVLRDCDRLNRRAVRRWVHLPKDTPSSMYHTSTRDGGLGIPSLVTRIPRIQKERRVRIEAIAEPDPQVRELLKTQYWQAKTAENVVRNEIGDETDVEERLPRNERMQEREYWRELLYSTTDGEGLRSHSSGSSYCCRFFEDGFLRLAGKEFVRAIHLRCGTLRTPARSNRGRVHGRGPMCPSCPDRTASLGHLLQNCGRTHLPRVKRHDVVVDMIATQLRKLQFTVEKEPHIPYGNSFLKPDMVAFRKRDRTVLVLDPTIVHCKGDLDSLASEKAAKYTNDAVFSWLVAKFGNSGSRACAVVEGVVLNWRGAWSPQSAEVLKAVGVKAGFLELLSFKVMKLGCFIYSTLRNRTDWSVATARDDKK